VNSFGIYKLELILRILGTLYVLKLLASIRMYSFKPHLS